MMLPVRWIGRGIGASLSNDRWARRRKLMSLAPTTLMPPRSAGCWVIALSMAAQTWSPSNEAPRPVTSLNRSLLGSANYFCLGTADPRPARDAQEIRRHRRRWWLHAISVAARCLRRVHVPLSGYNRAAMWYL